MSNAANMLEPLNAAAEQTAAASDTEDVPPELGTRVANDNAPIPPIVVLHPTGDGALLYRSLARVLVRRELMFASEIPTRDDCDAAERAG